MGFLENQTLTEHVFEIVCLFVCFLKASAQNFLFPVVQISNCNNKMFRVYYRFSHIRQKKWIEISLPVCVIFPLSKGRVTCQMSHGLPSLLYPFNLPQDGSVSPKCIELHSGYDYVPVQSKTVCCDPRRSRNPGWRNHSNTKCCLNTCLG